MKVSFALTVDGLIRALRGQAHGLADKAEARYRRPSAGSASRKPDRPMVSHEGRRRDDTAGR
jgi:hypothetical protein